MKQSINELNDHQITLHWWNMGSKKLDFRGSIAEYFKKQDFKVTSIKNPRSKELSGFRFVFALSGRAFRYDVFHAGIETGAIESIRLFLTILGDKATITTRHANIKINQ